LHAEGLVLKLAVSISNTRL